MYAIPTGFHFKVEFGANTNASKEDFKFQEVVGLSSEITTEEVREGGLNEYSYKLPTGVKYGNLVLKRGMFDDSNITAWCRKAIENFDFDPTTVRVTLLNHEHEDLASWNFTGAYPIKWSISDFKAQDNAIVVESIELAYRYFRKD
ncbi:MAG: phage tail protein [Bacteroidota bacterium]